MYPRTAGFRQLETAMAFADRTTALADWSRMDRQDPGKEIGLEVMAIWNELIVLDIAEVVTDCYGRSAHAARLKPNRPDRPRL